MKFEIREIRQEDCAAIFKMIRELSQHEGLLHRLKVTQNSLQENLFADNPNIFGLCVSHDNKIVGFALMSLMNTNFCYHTEKCLYLEEFFVQPEYRRKGLGKKLFQHMAKIALSKGCNRMEWFAVKGNEIASQFYEALGNCHLNDLVPYRLPKDELERLAM